jgi:myosin heavy subunit
MVLEVGQDVWIRAQSTSARDGDKLWISATIRSKEKSPTGIEVVSVSGSTNTASIKVSILPGQFETEELKLRNDSSAAMMQNLSDLPHLNEPEIIQCLRTRFEKGLIYTSTGSILIALNPSRVIEGLYSDAQLARYTDLALLPTSPKATAASSSGDSAPHVWDTARTVYHAMITKVIVDDHCCVISVGTSSGSFS